MRTACRQRAKEPQKEKRGNCPQKQRKRCEKKSCTAGRSPAKRAGKRIKTRPGFFCRQYSRGALSGRGGSSILSRVTPPAIFYLFSDFSVQKIDGEKKICYTLVRLYEKGFYRGSRFPQARHSFFCGHGNSPQGTTLKRRLFRRRNFIRTGIEVVITALTRNQVVRKGSWVRIPPCPPIGIAF